MAFFSWFLRAVHFSLTLSCGVGIAGKARSDCGFMIVEIDGGTEREFDGAEASTCPRLKFGNLTNFRNLCGVGLSYFDRAR